MTEDEARTKWCPHIRIWSPNGPANRDGQFKGAEDYSACIASDCMMWVKESGYYEKDGRPLTAEEMNKSITPESIGAVWVEEGRCGLVK